MILDIQIKYAYMSYSLHVYMCDDTLLMDVHLSILPTNNFQMIFYLDIKSPKNENNNKFAFLGTATDIIVNEM